eukprot:6189159-Pleurochrysis_carterae.AAC.4
MISDYAVIAYSYAGLKNDYRVTLYSNNSVTTSKLGLSATTIKGKLEAHLSDTSGSTDKGGLEWNVGRGIASAPCDTGNAHCHRQREHSLGELVESFELVPGPNSAG